MGSADLRLTVEADERRYRRTGPTSRPRPAAPPGSFRSTGGTMPDRPERRPLAAGSAYSGEVNLNFLISGGPSTPAMGRDHPNVVVPDVGRPLRDPHPLCQLPSSDAMVSI